MRYKKEVDGEILEYGQANILPDGFEETTKEYIMDKISPFVTISIPLTVFQASADLQKKLSEMALIFSDIKRRPDANGNLVLSNINISHVSAFLTATEHTQLTAVWVVFDEKIDALFATE